MDEYIKTLQNASNTVWKVFRQCVMEQKNPKLAFEQIIEMYKGTSAETYVTEYVKICTEVMGDAKEPRAYLEEALKVTAEAWSVFKKHIGKLYAEEMTDGDWNSPLPEPRSKDRIYIRNLLTNSRFHVTLYDVVDKKRWSSGADALRTSNRKGEHNE